MKAVKRLIFAVVLSSFCVVPLYLALIIVSNELSFDRLLLFFLAMSAVIAFMGILTVGLPVHFLLVWLRLSRPIHYALPGFTILVAIVAIMHPFGEDGALGILWQAILMGAFGAIVALVFRRVALGRNAAN